MTIKHFLLAVVLFVGFNLSAQDKKANTLETFSKIELGVRGLNISYEYVLNPTLVLDSYIGIGKEYQFGYTSQRKFFFDTGANFIAVGSHLEWYYNLDRRQSKGKNMTNNAGNFLNLNMEYDHVFLNNQSADYINAKLYWGIQRPLGNKFFYALNLGLGDSYNIETSSFSKIGLKTDIKFGYRL